MGWVDVGGFGWVLKVNEGEWVGLGMWPDYVLIILISV